MGPDSHRGLPGPACSAVSAGGPGGRRTRWRRRGPTARPGPPRPALPGAGPPAPEAPPSSQARPAGGGARTGRRGCGGLGRAARPGLGSRRHVRARGRGGPALPGGGEGRRAGGRGRRGARGAGAAGPGSPDRTAVRACRRSRARRVPAADTPRGPGLGRGAASLSCRAAGAHPPELGFREEGRGAGSEPRPREHAPLPLLGSALLPRGSWGRRDPAGGLWVRGGAGPAPPQTPARPPLTAPGSPAWAASTRRPLPGVLCPVRRGVPGRPVSSAPQQARHRLPRLARYGPP